MKAEKENAPHELQLGRGQTVQEEPKMSRDNIQPFVFEGNEVRTVTANGEPWFVLADVCRVLGLTNPTMVAAQVDEDDLSTAEVIDSLGRTQSARTVNESGIYQVVFISRKPEARVFRKWITSEILPAIRRTGGYQVPQSEDELIGRALLAVNRRLEEKEQALAIAAPKAEAFDDLLGAEGDFTVSSGAKVLSRSGVVIGPRKLFEHLRQIKWLYRSGRHWVAMQTAVERGYLTERARMYRDDMTGEHRVSDHPQVRLTPKGVARLREEFLGVEVSA